MGFAKLICDDNGATIAEAIRNGEANAISDGSFNFPYGTSSMVIEGSNQSGRVQADNVVPGHANQSAYRSELAGLYAIVAAILNICKVHNVEAGQVEIGCDGLSALQESFHPDIVPYDPTAPHYDLISAIRKLASSLPITWLPRHVAGHQDDVENAFLDRWALLNIEMDSAAKAHLHEYRDLDDLNSPRPPQYKIYGKPWALWIGGRKLCTDYRPIIQEITQGKDLREYWDRKERFGGGSSTDIDWIATESAMKNSTPSRRQWVTKHVSGHCGCGKMMLRWKKRLSRVSQVR